MGAWFILDELVLVETVLDLFLFLEEVLVAETFLGIRGVSLLDAIVVV